MFIQFRNFFIYVILLAAVACGKQEEKTPPAVSAPQGLAVSSPMQRLGEVEFELIAPKEVGGQWRRRIRFLRNRAANIIVEKLFGDSGWRTVGVTEEEGFFEDYDIREESRYRLGKRVESLSFPAVYDVILHKITQEKTVIKAHRVWVEGDVYLGASQLFIEADEFTLSGSILAYPLDSTGARPAGTLSVNARVVNGQGKVQLQGQKGKAAVRGRNGRPGQVQTCARPEKERTQGLDGAAAVPAQVGGNGGRVTVFASDLQNTNFSAPAGLGGNPAHGGAGGRGGALRSCSAELFRYYCGVGARVGAAEAYLNRKCPTGTERGRDGVAGAGGRRGALGVDGVVLIYKK